MSAGGPALHSRCIVCEIRTIGRIRPCRGSGRRSGVPSTRREPRRTFCSGSCNSALTCADARPRPSWPGSDGLSSIARALLAGSAQQWWPSLARLPWAVATLGVNVGETWSDGGHNQARERSVGSGRRTERRTFRAGPEPLSISVAELLGTNDSGRAQDAWGKCLRRPFLGSGPRVSSFDGG